MTYYKLTLTLKSPLGTALAADTLFGHLCWGLAMHEGESAISEFLAEMNGDEPPLIISDPFPRQYWPTPTIPFENQSNEEKSAAKPHDKKKLTKLNWISQNVFHQWINDLRWSTMPDCSECDGPEYLKASVAHVSINRLTSGPMETNGLFFDNQIFVKHPKSDDPQFDVYLLTSLPVDRVRQLFEWGLEGGYGRDSSVGMGHLIIGDISPWTPPTISSANALLTLGPMVPAKNDPTNGFWRVETRFGKLGGPLATMDDEQNFQPFKYPLTQIKTGAVFLGANQKFLGRMVHNIHPQRPEVVQYGYALTLPVRLASSLVQELEEPVIHES